MILERFYWSLYLAWHLRGQAGYPFRPPAAIRRDQARRVRAMVAFAYRYVPYYRETMDRLGLRPSDFRGVDDLARLPLLEREQLQRDPEYFVSTARPLDGYLRLRSGGSTGAPRTVYYDTAALFQDRAHAEREGRVIARFVGRRWGYRRVSILSPLASANEIGHLLRERSLALPGISIRRESLSLLDPPEVNVPRINAAKPDVLHSYGSYLEILFNYLHRTGAPFHRPRLVTYTSDSLGDAARRRIEQEFGIPVLSTYGAIEAMRIGFECEAHRGLHLNEDLYPVRIVDAEGRTLPPGEIGDVVVSNLVNRATVLLNYRLGDLAARLPDPCPCGRSLPLLSFPSGRSDDLIELPGGRQMHPQAIRIIFTEETEVWQYQVVQESWTRFRVSVVAPETGDREGIRSRVAERFARTFGPDITVDIVFVDSVPRTAGGKVRPVLSLCQRSVVFGHDEEALASHPATGGGGPAD